jgi:arginyl-tRNA synthetase
MVEFTQEKLMETEEKVLETFESALGTLALEASSELVQQELEALRRSAGDLVENVKEGASSLTSSLAGIANIDIGRDTSKEELNTFLARLPKTNDVKG